MIINEGSSHDMQVLTRMKTVVGLGVVLAGALTASMAAAETEDFGQYNLEYLTITDSSFERIGGPVANIYRGGRDESTFGPHVMISDSTFEEVGTNPRDGGDTSLRLWGAQDTVLTDNVFAG